MLSLSRVLCFLALVSQFCGFTASQASVEASTESQLVVNPVITQISGCVDVQNGTTSNCARSGVLTVRGLGFLNGLEQQKYPSIYVVFVIGSVGPFAHCQTIGTAPFNDTYAECAIFGVPFGQFAPGQVLAVAYNGVLTQITSEPFWGLSFAFEPVPVLDRMTGCVSTSSDGKSVSNCNVETDLVTLIGSGFMTAAENYIQVMLGKEIKYLQFKIHNELLVSLNDSMMVFSFGDSFQLLSEVDNANGQPLTFSIFPTEMSSDGVPIWSLEGMTIQFAQLPPPVITDLAVDGYETNCTTDMSTGKTRLLNCVPGVSQMLIYGRFLYRGVIVSVGGISARIISFASGDSSLAVVLPVSEWASGQFYDIIVTTFAGSATREGAVQFTTNAIITGVISCIDAGYDYSIYDIYIGRCLPGEKLTISVMNVKHPVSPRVLFKSYYNSIAAVECDAVMLDSRTVQCTMPQPPPDLWPEWSLATVFVQFGSGETTDGFSLQIPFDTPGAPRLTSITGCYSSSTDPLLLNQCLAMPTNTTVLTLQGVRMKNPFGANWTVVIHFNVYCQQPVVVDNETVTCLVPPLERTDLELDTPYPVLLRDARNQLQSNAGYITFVQSETHESPSPSTTSSSISTLAIALATIFSVTGAALLLAIGIVLYRRVCKRKTRGGVESSEIYDDSSTRHVELSEI